MYGTLRAPPNRPPPKGVNGRDPPRGGTGKRRTANILRQ